MKYVITGSLGNISKPITEELLKKGHTVTVVSSKPGNAAAIEKTGAIPAIGNLGDKDFLTRTFTGADAVYLMIPPDFAVTDWLPAQKNMANGFTEAVKNSGVKNVLVLSSIGAHLKKGAGPVDGLAYLEDQLNGLEGINVLALRPGYFYYNLFSMIPMIKNAGIMGGAQPADQPVVLAHTADIAAEAAERLDRLDFHGKGFRYIGSDEKTWKEITDVLSAAVNKPGTPWVEFTDEQSLQGMLGAGLSRTIAEGYLAMGQVLRNGTMIEDYKKNSPVTGKIKLEDFAKEFAAAYQA